MGLAPTPGSTPNAEARKDPAFKLIYKGQTYVVRFTEITAKTARRFREQAGQGPMQMFSSLMDGDFDVDRLAALIWLARIVNGEKRLSLSEVEDEIGYADMFGDEVELGMLDDAEEQEEGEDPDPLSSSDVSSDGTSPSSDAPTG